MASSTLVPKTQRNSMLPPRCSRPPCMNIDESAVNHVAGCDSAAPVTPRWPSQSDLTGLADEVALAARVRELVRDRPVVHDGRAVRPAEDRPAVADAEEVHDDVRDDQRDRHDRGRAGCRRCPSAGTRSALRVRERRARPGHPRVARASEYGSRMIARPGGRSARPPPGPPVTSDRSPATTPAQSSAAEVRGRSPRAGSGDCGARGRSSPARSSWDSGCCARPSARCSRRRTPW